MDGYARHVKNLVPAEFAEELAAVDALAEKLLTHIRSTRDAIAQLHIHGAQSRSIQAHFAHLLRTELAFDEEVVLTPQEGFVTHARPDFYFSLGPGRGVIAEVERGGTTTNNHDLKDVWKAHIAADAQHLFLIVPGQQLEGRRHTKGATVPDRFAAARCVLWGPPSRDRRTQRARIRVLRI